MWVYSEELNCLRFVEESNMDLNRIRQLAGTRPLYENVQAVPGIGAVKAGDRVNPRWSQGSDPMEVVQVLPSGKAIVRDEFGNKGTIPVADLVPANVQEEFSVDDIDAAQNDIDLDQGSQFMEKAQVVSCNQDNPASVVDACAMDTSTVVNEEDEDEEEVDEAYDLNNGYNDRDVLDGQDYFPTGADGPVVDKVGPSGARQGDNPEQKKMEVTETHKELVYNYRRFLKESTKK